jgi:DNA-binding CsgD family transcriptional regulator/tetratricopeptide (TPR) repeat protein
LLGCAPYDVAVSVESDALVDAGERALEAGEWSAARSSFEAALELEETPEALRGLGNALWWLDETEASLRSRERAYAAFRHRPDPFQAAAIALQLAAHYGGNLGDVPAARGWGARAGRLVEEFDLAPLKGWLLLSRAAGASTAGDPQAGEGFARQAREIARRLGDTDLELCALSQIGGALLLMGRVEEGAPLLDEAMAGALGGEGGPETVVHASCVTIVCCSRAAELKRAAQWIRAARDFNRRYGSPHLDAVCRTAYGAVLLATGRWAEAETELQSALKKISTTAEPLVRAEALAKLAELRLAQGRLDEAARLLDGIEGHTATMYVTAALHLYRRELVPAASILRRRLRTLSEASLESAHLLELLTEVEIEQGAHEAALTKTRRLTALGASSSCDVTIARGERALGRALLAASEAGDAVPHLEQAFEAFGSLELPLEACRSRLLLARAIAVSEPDAAIAEARGALASLEALGAARDADAAAAFLRTLGVKAARSGPKGVGVLTKRELEVLRLLGEGLSNPQMAERLFLSRKTVEQHVANVLFKLELKGRAEAAAYAVRHLER